jgi:beta-lactamase class A
MAFYRCTAKADQVGRHLVDAILADISPAGLTRDCFGFTLVIHSDATAPEGYSHNGDRSFYPCSVVKMFWMAACLQQIETGAVTPHPELDRALHDMIQWSSNTATNYIVDLVTETTGDTLLDGAAFDEWCEKRSWANLWLRSTGLPEFESINVCQKNMDDDRYGRERQLVDALGHNSLTTEATARLFEEIFNGESFPDRARHRMQELIHRRHDLEAVAADPRSGVKGNFGAGLPSDAELWSKSGRTEWTGDERASYRRHDAGRIAVPGLAPFTLVVFTEGRYLCESDTVLPRAAAAAIDAIRRFY